MAYVVKVKNPNYTTQVARLLQDLYSRKDIKVEVLHSDQNIVVAINDFMNSALLYEAVNIGIPKLSERGFECEVVDSGGIENKDEFIKKYIKEDKKTKKSGS